MHNCQLELQINMRKLSLLNYNDIILLKANYFRLYLECAFLWKMGEGDKYMIFGSFLKY